MESLFERYEKLQIDGSLISLAPGDLASPHFCHPANAAVIGFEGCILYCFLPEYPDMVFAANPESCADTNVYPLASCFSDFLQLLLSCGSANVIEQIVWMNEEQFNQHRREELENQTDEHNAVLSLLAQEFELAPMENPFVYVKDVQATFDDSRIKYRDEYYDTLGLERPDGTRLESGFEFESVTFTFKKPL